MLVKQYPRDVRNVGLCSVNIWFEIRIKAKDVGRDIRNEDSLKLEDEEDDFSKQLDDLMVDITCIPGEEFQQLKDDSQNDDELLLEIQELLS